MTLKDVLDLRYNQSDILVTSSYDGKKLGRCRSYQTSNNLEKKHKLIKYLDCNVLGVYATLEIAGSKTARALLEVSISNYDIDVAKKKVK